MHNPAGKDRMPSCDLLSFEFLSDTFAGDKKHLRNLIHQFGSLSKFPYIELRMIMLPNCIKLTPP
jgi:hypothetical protein